MKELDILIQFSDYLKSDSVKVKIVNNNIFTPHQYSKEIIVFFGFWCSSTYFTTDYTSLHSERNFFMNKDTDRVTLLSDITFIIRRERFSSGFVASHIDILEKAIDIIIDMEMLSNEENIRLVRDTGSL